MDKTDDIVNIALIDGNACESRLGRHFEHLNQGPVDRGGDHAVPGYGNVARLDAAAAEDILQELALIGIDKPAAVALAHQNDNLLW